MKVLVTGSKGQLGSEIVELSTEYPQFSFFHTDLPQVDLTDKEGLEDFIVANKIEAIINCAAYTAVDKAEKELALAELVNSMAVGNLVAMSEKYQVKLIHISTDYVFDGTSHIPYTENMPVSPLGIYGKTKRAGELEVIHSSSNSILIRTSWLYSAFGNNFVKTMLRLGDERDSLGVIFDQVGTPTYAGDLAKACLDILSKVNRLDQNSKVYHFSNEGVCSWYDFAKCIMDMGGIDCQVNPIESKDYPTPAARPHYSVLNKSKIKADFGIQIPYWRDSLKDCIVKLGEK